MSEPIGTDAKLDEIDRLRARVAELAAERDAGNKRAEKAEAERGAILSVCKQLVEVVEGWSGLTTHGTFRAEKSNLRLKDISEWAALYHAVKQPQDVAKTQMYTLADALRNLADCVDDGCFCSEMQMATAMDEARAALKGKDDE